MHDWASARRRRWSASRLVAAIALHVLVLVSLTLAIDRIERARPTADRATTLVTVVLHPAPPPPAPQAAPSPRRARSQPPAPGRANASASRAPGAPPREGQAQSITLPASPAPAIAAAAPPASAPQPDLQFLDNAATRQAIRAAAQGGLASRGNALTHEDPGSELLAADGSHCNCKRNLPPPPPAQALAQDIAAAHKQDCMKGDFAGAGMGLLSAPFLLAAEALGKCAHKL
ncbi:MAG: hypothetical protein ACJ8GJ_10585 [Vitreoscilla sp.]